MSGSKRTPTWLIWVLLGAIALAAVLAYPSEPQPYDLGSYAPTGYSGLRDIAEELGGEVTEFDASEVDSELVATHPTVFIPSAGGASASMAASWESYMDAGGRLVVGEPVPELGIDVDEEVADADTAVLFGNRFYGVTDLECEIEGLQDLSRIEISITAPPIDVGSGSTTSCFDEGPGPHVAQFGELGRLTVLSSPSVFSNEAMGAPTVEDLSNDGGTPPVADNAAMAVYLLTPASQGESSSPDLAIVTSGVDSLLSGQTKQLTDLISPGVKLGLLQLVVAGLLYFWFRSRRTTPILPEDDAVSTDSSQLTRALGSLMQQRKSAARASAALRQRAYRDFVRVLDLPIGTPVEVVAHRYEQRYGTPADQVLSALGSPVTDDAQLSNVSQRLDEMSQEARR